MADESSFIVEILLRAKDEASATIAALRAEVAALKKEAATSGNAPLSKDLGDTSRAAKDAERDIGKARGEHERLRGSARSGEVKQGRRDLEDIGTAARKTEGDLGRATKGIDDHRSAQARLRTELGAGTRTKEQSSKSIKDLADRAEEAAKSYEMFDSAVKRGKVTSDDARRGYQQFSLELGGLARQFKAGSDEALKFSRTAADAKARVGDFGPAEAEIRRVLSAYKDFDQQAKRGVLTTAEVRRGYKDFSSELGSIGRAFRAGSAEAQKFLGMAETAGKNAKKAGYISPGDWNWDTVIAKTAARFDDWGIKIVSLSANLRGLALAAIVGLAQQLDTAVVGLAGGLFSVASAAVQAGAALGGALVSGISQAIPVLAVVGATVERLKNVLQAVQLTGQMQQSTAASPFANQIQQMQNASSIVGAQHSLATAYEGVAVAQAHVRTSQEQLTLARINAIRNIQDLTLAEKDAKLQAEGANISLTESQRALQMAIQSGNTAGIEAAQLAVKEAELQQKKAQIAVPRAEEERARAQRQGVSRNPQVISAQEGLRAARVAMREQKFQIEQAQQQLKIAQLQSKEVGGGTTQQRQLKALTSKFSGPEKALYDSLVRIENMLKSPSSPLAKVSDYLVAPFAKGVSKIASLLGSKGALAPLEGLAKTMGKGIEEIDNVFLGSKGIHFFDEMAKDASKNIPLIAHGISQLLGWFQTIAKVAAPFLHEIIKGWDELVTHLNTRDSSPEGVKKLEGFFQRAAGYARDIFHLAGAFGKLMMALGRDAAPSGDSLIQSLTNSMNKATEWVNTHGPQVKKFFEETAETVRSIGRLLLSIGGTMIKVFNPSSMAAFQGFISTIILPALTKVLNVLGWITTAILNIAKAIPGGTLVLQTIAGIVLTIMGIGKLYEPFHKTVVMVQALTAATKAFFAAEGMGRFKAAWEAFEGTLKKVKGTTEEVAAAQEGLAAEETAAAGAAEADAGAQAGLATAEGEAAAGGAAAGAGGAAAAGGGVAALGRKALPFLAVPAGLAAIFGTKGAENGSYKGLPTGSESFGAKLDRYGAKETSDLLHLNIGGFLGGIFGSSNDESKSEEKLRKFGNELKALHGNLKNLPAGQMQKIHDEATKLGEDPSLNKFKGKLEGIADATSPSLIATKKWSEKMKQYMESLGPAAKGVAETFQNINQTTGSILEQIREVVHSNSKKIAEDLGTNTKAGKDALVANFGQAVESINKSMAEGTVSTGKGMQEIGRLVATALKEYGINPSQINKYVAATTKLTNSQQEAANLHAAGFASGGWVGAVPGGRVITAGEAGHNEVVLTTDPSKAFAQGGLLREYLRAAPRAAEYAAGGFVGDAGKNFTYGKERQISTDLDRLAKAKGWTIYGISGYRTPQESVSVGGFSNDPHTRGEAIDIGINSQMRETASKLTASLLAKYGLERPFYPAEAKEINHIQLLKGAKQHPGAGGTGSAEGGGPMGPGFEISAPKVKGLHGQMQRLAQGAINKVTSAAAKYVEKTIGQLPSPASGTGSFAGVTGSGGSPSANERLGRKMMEKIYKASEWPYLQKLWTQESGWSDTAENKPGAGWLGHENASGIPQALGHGNVYPKGDARAQIAWGLKYIKETYTTPARAWAHEVADNWYAAGGRILGRAPWGGRAVPIVAHEGERVLNPNQFGEVANLAGTTSSALDSHLGFNNKTPRQHFAPGGHVPTAPSLQFGQGSLNEIINVDYALKLFEAIKKGFATINHHSQLAEKALIPFVNAITDEQTGVIAKMQAGFTALTSRLSTRATKTNFKKVPGSGREFSSVSQLEMTDRSLKDLEIERKNLEDQAKVLTITERQIKARIQKLSKQKQTSAVRKQLQQLVAAFNKVIEAKQSLEELAAQNIEQAAQQTQQRIQNMITEVSNSFAVSAGQLQVSQASAQAQGRYFELPAIDAQIAQNASAHIQALTGALREAEVTGNPELVSSIKQEMQSLSETIVQATAQQFADAEQAIQQEAGATSSKVGLLNTYAQTLNAQGRFRQSGEFSRSAANFEIGSAQKQIAAYEPLLQKAREEGNIGQIDTLTEAINQLHGVIVTNEQALKDNTSAVTQAYTAEVTRQGQFSTGIYGGLISLLQTMGAITGQTNVAGEAGLYQQSNKALQETNKNLIGGEGGLNKLLGSLGIQIPNLEGLSGEALVKALSSLNISGIESKMDPAQQQAFEGIINALLQNSLMIETNNKELSTLNGQLLQPQAFSSAPWTKFRDAVFTGMGGLMPSIAGALNIPAANNPALTGAGYASSSPAAYIGEQNIHIATPMQVPDPSHMGKQIAWAQKSAT